MSQRVDMTPSGRSAMNQVCSDTQPRPREWLQGVKDFWSGFFLMLHWGALGPIVNRFLVPFSILLEYELYTLICLCKNTFILLSFEVWVTTIIHVLNVVLCIFYVLQHLSTWLWMRSDEESELLIGIWIAWNAVRSLKHVAKYQVITMHNFKCIVPWKKRKWNEMKWALNFKKRTSMLSLYSVFDGENWKRIWQYSD